MSTTKHTSFIPMSPELLPRQKLNEVVTIPDHPKGLVALARWCVNSCVHPFYSFI